MNNNKEEEEGEEKSKEDNNNSSSSSSSISSNSRKNAKEELIRELWNARQQLYRLYDLEGMNNEWRARDLIALYELFEEYGLADILSEKMDRDSMISYLNSVRDKIDSRMREAGRKGETRRKGYLAKQLDKVLTLIALAEKHDREGLNRLVSTYHLLNRNDKQLLGALKEYIDSRNEDNLSGVIQSIKEELEREIIELKKRLLQ